LAPWGSKIEVLVDADEGSITVGTKRNRMLEKAKNDYVCFLDDDDLISRDYVAKVMGALATRPDCVGLEGIYTRSGQDPRLFKHSIKFTSWYEDNGVYFRNPNHLNPIRRDLASVARFPDLVRGEDHAYSQRVQPLLKTEVYIEGPIYHYLSGDSSIVPEGV
jgi:glycosyltransferase involved in cell wall biosynthesis